MYDFYIQERKRNVLLIRIINFHNVTKKTVKVQLQSLKII